MKVTLHRFGLDLQPIPLSLGVIRVIYIYIYIYIYLYVCVISLLTILYTLNLLRICDTSLHLDDTIFIVFLQC